MRPPEERAPAAFVAFTKTGEALARTLQAHLGGSVTCAHGAKGFSLEAWTREAFAKSRALVFVGAAGIAVRAAAPFLKGKAVDPAVVAVDECGRFAVPLAGGHLGGANDLARRIGAICGATPVITTATDAHGLFAVDEWARRQDCAVADPAAIRAVSARILAGETVGVYAPFPIAGDPPPGVRLAARAEEAEVLVDIRRRPPGPALQLIPRLVVLGAGCRRGTGRDALEAAFSQLCEQAGLREEAVALAATIEQKAEEPGLLAFCAGRGLPLQVYSAQALGQAAGSFTASAFVERTVGVDNVCERSAALAAKGPLLERKYVSGGVAMALALRPWRLDWRWRHA